MRRGEGRGHGGPGAHIDGDELHEEAEELALGSIDDEEALSG